MKKQDEEKIDLILGRFSEDKLMDLINKYPSPEELKGTQQFSAEHENRMRNIIKEAQKREQEKHKDRRKSRVYRIVINVAAAFGGLCFVTTLMAFTVPPIRIILQDYFMTRSEEYISIESQVDEDQTINELYNFPTYIPNGFKIVSDMESDDSLMVAYSNETDDFLRFERYVGLRNIKIDVENAENREIDINGNRGQLIVKNGLVTIIFNNSDFTFNISTDISEEEAIRIAESIIEKE